MVDSDHICPGQIHRDKQMIILSLSLFFMQIFAYLSHECEVMKHTSYLCTTLYWLFQKLFVYRGIMWLGVINPLDDWVALTTGAFPMYIHCPSPLELQLLNDKFIC